MSARKKNDEGFLLLGVLVLLFLMLLALAVAAPRVARGLQRDREQESARRAGQYQRALRVYYRTLKHYPGSMEQLEKTNTQRFLRQKYVDPLTGKSDWRLIHVGENKTKVKGFFGEDLPGLSAGLGSASSLASTTGGTGTSSGTTGSAFNNSLGSGSGSAGSGSSFGSSSTGSPSAFGSSSGGLGSSSAVVAATSGSTGVSSVSATGPIGSGGPIMGIGSSRSGDAMLVVNEQTTYDTWEFLYDPRIEQMYAKATLLGGGSSGSSSATGRGWGVHREARAVGPGAAVVGLLGAAAAVGAAAVAAAVAAAGIRRPSRSRRSPGGF